MSDGEFAMSELGDLEGLALLLFGMMCLLLLLLVVWLVTVCGGAVLVRNAHVHIAGMLAGSRSIWSHTLSPAPAITGF